jgi:hypothetical protein
MVSCSGAINEILPRFHFGEAGGDKLEFHMDLNFDGI